MRSNVLRLLLVLFFSVASALSGAELRWCLCEREVVANGPCDCCCVTQRAASLAGCADCGGGGGSGAPAAPEADGSCLPPLECLVTLFDGELAAQGLVGAGAAAVPVPAPASPDPAGPALRSMALSGPAPVPLGVRPADRHPVSLSGPGCVVRFRVLRI